MLQSIDILIGFTVVMLILSVIVTMLVQFVTSTLLNLKGRVLKAAVAELLLLLDRGSLKAAEAQGIAKHLLRDALVGRKVPGLDRWRLANVVHREELVKLILDFAADADLTRADALAKGQQAHPANEQDLRAVLVNSLRRNGISEPPGEILNAVRGTMLALEQARPELATDVRQSMALLTHASSDFLGKINAWFDQTIDRTVDSFTARSRIWTLIFSALVAIFFEVNTFELVQRLSADQDTRQALVTAAINNPERFERMVQPPASDGGAPGTAASPANAQATRQPAVNPSQAIAAIRHDPELNRLVDADLIKWPDDFGAWAQYWSPDRTTPSSPYQLLTRLIGILLTIGLLGLGAPLWYQVLRNLIQLRSLVAQKDDEQRRVRQTSQEPPSAEAPAGGAPARAVPPSLAVGERGDLEAVG
jgi:hypothetical protein